jgi:hypothetical protein
MKNLFFLIVLSTISFGYAFSQNVVKTVSNSTYTPPDSVTIADGTKIPYSEFKKKCDDAWNASFGKMTNEDKKLFEGVKTGVAIPKEDEVVEPEKLMNPILI